MSRGLGEIQRDILAVLTDFKLASDWTPDHPRVLADNKLGWPREAYLFPLDRSGQADPRYKTILSLSIGVSQLRLEREAWKAIRFGSDYEPVQASWISFTSSQTRSERAAHWNAIWRASGMTAPNVPRHNPSRVLGQSVRRAVKSLERRALVNLRYESYEDQSMPRLRASLTPEGLAVVMNWTLRHPRPSLTFARHRPTLDDTAPFGWPIP